MALFATLVDSVPDCEVLAVAEHVINIVRMMPADRQLMYQVGRRMVKR